MAAVILDSRIVNALFAEAKPSGAAVEKVSGLLEEYGPEGMAEGMKDALNSALWVLESFADHYGGLWVGGSATLTDRMLVFEPNAMNRFLHENGEALHLEMPLDAIRSVEDQPGWFTGIIAISTGDRTFSIRSYRSKAFSQSIRAAAGL